MSTRKLKTVTPALAAPELRIEPTVPRPPVSWKPLAAVGALAGLWWAALALLDWQYANPVTLHQPQIRQARLVVRGQLAAEGERKVVILERYVPPGRSLPTAPVEEVTLDNLPLELMRPGQEYLIPISLSPDGGHRVTQAELPRRREDPVQLDDPLVYPVTPETLRQLEQIQSVPRIDQTAQ